EIVRSVAVADVDDELRPGHAEVRERLLHRVRERLGGLAALVVQGDARGGDVLLKRGELCRQRVRAALAPGEVRQPPLRPRPRRRDRLGMARRVGEQRPLAAELLLLARADLGLADLADERLQRLDPRAAFAFAGPESRDPGSEVAPSRELRGERLALSAELRRA